MSRSKIKNRISGAYLMCFCLCGFIVFCALSGVRAEQVEVMTASGTVEVQLEGTEDYTAAEEGMTLDAGDKIKTGSGGSAELSFNEANTNVVRLNENTDASITLSGDEKMEVFEGEVFSSVSDLPSGSAFEIRTPTAVSGARGTDWVTKVSDDGTDVEAVDSVPYVKHFESSGVKSSQITLIQPGQMTTVKRFQPPMQPRPMNAGSSNGRR
jgi:ferric-dicitrate binding protein FerR (iron transport regulator)